MTSLIPVPFRGATLYLVDQGDTPYTPMKPIVEGMGLSWHGQFEKLNDNKERWGIRVIRIPTDGGHQEMVCLPLRKLPGWLMTIQPTRVKPEIRETVITYQNECDDALWDYWTKGHAERRPTAPQSFADALQLAADQQRIIEQQHAQLEAQRPAVAFHDQMVKNTETLIDFAQAFSLLKGRTGQQFNHRTFLEFLRQHGIARHPNRHSNIGRDRFYPRQGYIGSWFVSAISPIGAVEWLLRPMALAGIVALIERDRREFQAVSGYLVHQEDAA